MYSQKIGFHYYFLSTFWLFLVIFGCNKPTETGGNTQHLPAKNIFQAHARIFGNIWALKDSNAIIPQQFLADFVYFIYPDSFQTRPKDISKVKMWAEVRIDTATQSEPALHYSFEQVNNPEKAKIIDGRPYNLAKNLSNSNMQVYETDVVVRARLGFNTRILRVEGVEPLFSDSLCYLFYENYILVLRQTGSGDWLVIKNYVFSSNTPEWMLKKGVLVYEHSDQHLYLYKDFSFRDWEAHEWSKKYFYIARWAGKQFLEPKHWHNDQILNWYDHTKRAQKNYPQAFVQKMVAPAFKTQQTTNFEHPDTLHTVYRIEHSLIFELSDSTETFDLEGTRIGIGLDTSRMQATEEGIYSIFTGLKLLAHAETTHTVWVWNSKLADYELQSVCSDNSIFPPDLLKTLLQNKSYSRLSLAKIKELYPDVWANFLQKADPLSQKSVLWWLKVVAS